MTEQKNLPVFTQIKNFRVTAFFANLALEVLIKSQVRIKDLNILHWDFKNPGNEATVAFQRPCQFRKFVNLAKAAKFLPTYTSSTLDKLCVVQQYESGTSSVQARMCSTNQEHLQYKRGCAVRIRQMFSTSEDVQYESGTCSVQAMMCSTSEEHLQYEQECAV